MRRPAILASLACFAACGYDGVATSLGPANDLRIADASGDASFGDASVDGALIREDDPPPIDVGDASVVYADAGNLEAATAFDAGPLPTSPGSPLIYVVSTRFWTFDPVSGGWGGGTQLPANGCPSLSELAVDAFGNLFAVGAGSGALYRVNPSTVQCSAIGAGGISYPQALTFAPRGTLNPSVEELVGYGANGDYVRVDTDQPLRLSRSSTLMVRRLMLVSAWRHATFHISTFCQCRASMFMTFFVATSWY